MRGVSHILNATPSGLLFSLYLMVLVGYPFAAIMSTVIPILGSYPAYVLKVFIFTISTLLIIVGIFRAKINYASLFLTVFFLLYVLRLGYDYLVYDINSIQEIALSFFLGTFMPAIALILSNRLEIDFDELANSISICGTLMMFMLITLWFLGYSYNPWPEEIAEYNRFALERLNPISMGVYSSICFLSCSLTIRNGSASRQTRLIATLGIALAFVVLILSNSKGPLLSLIVTIIFINRKNVVYLGEFFLLATASVLLMLSLTDLMSGLIERIALLASGELDESSLERLTGLSRAYEMFLENMVFGSAAIIPNSIVGYPHNLIFETAMALGIIGLLVLSVVCLSALKIIVKFEHHNTISALFIFFACFSMVSGSLYSSASFFFLLACIISANKWIRGSERYV